MIKRERRIIWLAGLTSALAMCGCTGAEEDVFGTFVCDFLRNGLAAFLF